jgi:hypothetical protein
MTWQADEEILVLVMNPKSRPEINLFGSYR